MDEYNKYAALADTIKIEDITSCERKQSILHQIRVDDPRFDKLWICTDEQVCDGRDYVPSTSTELSWLGYFLGSNSIVKELYISNDLFDISGMDVFRRGLGNNKSIHQLTLECFDLFEGQILRVLDQFIKNDNSLLEIKVNECQVGAEGTRQLSLAIGGCNKSLKRFRLSRNRIDGHLVDIITALSMHPQLTELCLSNMNMGRNECTALSTLLRCTTTQLENLNLFGNNIDDEGIEVLVNALSTNGNKLQELDLSNNEQITCQGWKTLSTLLETPGCKLETMHIGSNNIGNEGALVFANALVNNSTLNKLDLDYCSITREGWAPFSKLLCDTSSINNTYLSNHTLYYVGDHVYENNFNDIFGMEHHLVLNEDNQGQGKGKIAMSKIVHVHSHFDVQPFFEWEFKVLPIMISWFTKASSYTAQYDEKVNKMKLSVVYDFIKEFPMLYVEPVTRKGLAEYTTMEEELLQGSQIDAEQKVRLEEIRQCKARAMRRLG